MKLFGGVCLLQRWQQSGKKLGSGRKMGALDLGDFIQLNDHTLKNSMVFPQKIKLASPPGPATTLPPGTHLQEPKAGTTQTLTHPRSQQHYLQGPKVEAPKCPSTDDWVNRFWSIHTTNYHLNRKVVLTCHSTGETMLSENKTDLKGQTL